MLTVDRLRELLHYDPETGRWVWLARPTPHTRRIKAGDEAGWVAYGYCIIGLYGRKYRAHNLAFFYMTGEWPKGEVDHRDLNRGNNRWDNLRDGTHQQNTCNQGMRSTNTTGFKGVHFFKKARRYQAKIWVRGKQIHLGYRGTAEEAHALYVEAAERHHGEFARVA